MNETGHACTAGGLLPTSLTDRRNARLFVNVHRRRFRHMRGVGWHSWEGHHWSPARGEEALLWAAGDLAERLAESDPSGTFTAKDLVARKRHILSTPGVRALLTQAKAFPGLPVEADARRVQPRSLHPSPRAGAVPVRPRPGEPDQRPGRTGAPRPDEDRPATRAVRPARAWSSLGPGP
ncbi:hypothetical protein ACWC4J_13015 [Streptomyces sp. NPDC001356]